MAGRKMTIDERIASKEQLIETLKKKLEAAETGLAKLKGKRDSEKAKELEQELKNAIKNSDKSIDEILKFINKK